MCIFKHRPNLENTMVQINHLPNRHKYLIIVAFGEEQGTKLAVQRCLVGLVAMFG